MSSLGPKFGIFKKYLIPFKIHKYCATITGPKKKRNSYGTHTQLNQELKGRIYSCIDIEQMP